MMVVAPKAKTPAGRFVVWAIGSTGTLLGGLVMLTATHVLTWFDPPDTTAKILDQNALLIRSLTETMSRMNATSAEPDAGGSSLPAVELSQAPAPAPLKAVEASATATTVLASSGVSSYQQLVADTREVPRVPIQAAPDQATGTAAASSSVPVSAFGVFEGQSFSLCGHDRFSAQVNAAAAPATIVFRSPDRSISGAGFRGFEASVTAGHPQTLWEGCTIAAGYQDVAGKRHIAVSVIEGGTP